MSEPKTSNIGLLIEGLVVSLSKVHGGEKEPEPKLECEL